MTGGAIRPGRALGHLCRTARHQRQGISALHAATHNCRLLVLTAKRGGGLSGGRNGAEGRGGWWRRHTALSFYCLSIRRRSLPTAGRGFSTNATAMHTASFAAACLAIIPQTTAQLFLSGDTPEDRQPGSYHIKGSDLKVCNSLEWGSPICLVGHRLENVSWTSDTALPPPANIIFQNPNATDDSKQPSALVWCANISVVESRGLALYGCNKTVDQVSLWCLQPPCVELKQAFALRFYTVLY